jgi:hypothetical protein
VWKQDEMENKRNAVVRWGLTFGLTFGLIMAFLGATLAVGSRLLEGSLIDGQTTPGQLLPAAGITLLIGCGLDLVYLALFFVAGIMTARQSGSVGAASLAGLLAGGVGALVNSVASLIVTFVFPTTLTSLGASSTLTSDTSTFYIVGFVAGLIFGLVIWGGLGAGLGALGGLIGQSQFRAAHPELAQSGYYAYAPYTGYPGYPPAPPVGAYPPPPGAYPAYPAYPPYPPPPGTPYPPAPNTEQPPQSGAYPPPDAYPPAQPGQ